MTLENPAYLTDAEYLEAEKLAEVRHEYVKGKVFAMPDNSRRHNHIVLNTVPCPESTLALAEIYEGVDFSLAAE